MRTELSSQIEYPLYLWQWARLYGVSKHILTSWIKNHPETAYLLARDKAAKRSGLTPKDCDTLVAVLGMPKQG